MLAYKRSVLLALGLYLILPLGLDSASAQNLGASSYQCLTSNEFTIFCELLALSASDTFSGPFHSNDTVSIVGDTQFLDSVSLSSDALGIAPGSHPYFAVPPMFWVPRIALPYDASDLRAAAASMGLFFDDDGAFQNDRASRLVFNDTQGWYLYQWYIGEPWNSTTAVLVASEGPPTGQAIFIDGYLEIKGIVRGQVTVGAAGNPVGMGKNCIRLIDDLRYWFADSVTGLFNDSTAGYTDLLGIVSEGDIVVGNTAENGRDNSAAGSDIVITAALVALNQSFTFEDQNDNYIWEYSTGYLGSNIDDRGTIFLNGSLAQQRRGYVHRNNHGVLGGGPPGSTGYQKSYHYDRRFRTQGPPHDIPARHLPVLLPQILDFGAVSIQTSDSLPLLLSNEGGTLIEIESVSVDCSAFWFSAPETLWIWPGDTLALQTAFCPLSVGLYNALLRFDLELGEDLIVPMAGVGVSVGIVPESPPIRNDLIHVFPNPFNHELRISYLGQNSPAKVVIYDCAGRGVEETFLQQGSGQGSSWIWHPQRVPAGLYFVEATTSDRKFIEKVIYLK